MSDDNIIHITVNDLEPSEESSIVHISEQELIPESVLGIKSVMAQESNGIELEEKICPVDQQIIKEGQELVACTSCGTPYHAQCWEYNNGCAVFNCGGKSSKHYSIASESREVQEIDVEQISSPLAKTLNRDSDPMETFVQFLRKVLGS